MGCSDTRVALGGRPDPADGVGDAGDTGRRPARARPGGVGDRHAAPHRDRRLRALVRLRAGLLAGRLRERRGPRAGHALDDRDDGRALGARPDRQLLDRVPPDGAWLGDRARARDAPRRPDRDRARPQRPRRPRVSRPGRVPPADPVRGADPVALPDARPDAPERGLPGGLRRLLADSRADDVRRPRRRPRGHRHRTVVRGADARAPLAHHAAERGAVHRHRDAHRVDGRADPRVHRGALHGHPGPRKLLNYAQSYGLTTQLYALALATGVLGVCTHLLFTAVERRALRWHPSQRAEAV